MSKISSIDPDEAPLEEGGSQNESVPTPAEYLASSLSLQDSVRTRVADILGGNPKADFQARLEAFSRGELSDKAAHALFAQLFYQKPLGGYKRAHLDIADYFRYRNYPIRDLKAIELLYWFHHNPRTHHSTIYTLLAHFSGLLKALGSVEALQKKLDTIQTFAHDSSKFGEVLKRIEQKNISDELLALWVEVEEKNPLGGNDWRYYNISPGTSDPADSKNVFAFMEDLYNKHGREGVERFLAVEREMNVVRGKEGHYKDHREEEIALALAGKSRSVRYWKTFLYGNQTNIYQKLARIVPKLFDEDKTKIILEAIKQSRVLQNNVIDVVHGLLEFADVPLAEFQQLMKAVAAFEYHPADAVRCKKILGNLPPHDFDYCIARIKDIANIEERYLILSMHRAYVIDGGLDRERFDQLTAGPQNGWDALPHLKRLHQIAEVAPCLANDPAEYPKRVQRLLAHQMSDDSVRSLADARELCAGNDFRIDCLTRLCDQNINPASPYSGPRLLQLCRKHKPAEVLPLLVIATMYNQGQGQGQGQGQDFHKNLKYLVDLFSHPETLESLGADKIPGLERLMEILREAPNARVPKWITDPKLTDFWNKLRADPDVYRVVYPYKINKIELGDRDYTDWESGTAYVSQDTWLRLRDEYTATHGYGGMPTVIPDRVKDRDAFDYFIHKIARPLTEQCWEVDRQNDRSFIHNSFYKKEKAVYAQIGTPSPKVDIDTSFLRSLLESSGELDL